MVKLTAEERGILGESVGMYEEGIPLYIIKLVQNSAGIYIRITDETWNTDMKLAKINCERKETLGRQGRYNHTTP